MPYAPQNPLIVQSDRSLLLEVDNALYSAARDELARFAELEKSPEHIHTYRITPLSLWNAASAGVSATDILGTLERLSVLPRHIFYVAEELAADDPSHTSPADESLHFCRDARLDRQSPCVTLRSYNLQP